MPWRRTCSLVAMMPASHTEGLQFDPGQEYHLATSRTQTLIGPATKQGAAVSKTFLWMFRARPSLLQLEHRAHGVVVPHPLSMREALGSIPGVSTACLKAARNARVGQTVQHEFVCNRKTVASEWASTTQKCPATRNRTRDHLIAAKFYSQVLYQLSYSRLIF